jgi:hypothetical protein
MTSEHPAGHEVIAVEVPGGQLFVEMHPSGAEPAELIAEAQS